MYALIIGLHIIACFILITVILLQAGRGGGLSELFGSGATQTIFGTRASTFLTRTTTCAAITFLLTCISLTVLSSRRVKSLMAEIKETKVAEEKLPAVETQEVLGETAEKKPAEVQEEQSGGSEQEAQVPPE